VIEATGRNVARVSYATSLMKKGVLISTTEHALSAFVGVGLDNAIVELDNLELPILDGSALPIVEMIQGGTPPPAPFAPLHAHQAARSRSAKATSSSPSIRLTSIRFPTRSTSPIRPSDMEIHGSRSIQRQLRQEHRPGAHVRVLA
jgi:hypothetical protein